MSVETVNTGWQDVLIAQGMASGALAGDTQMAAWVEEWAEHHAPIEPNCEGDWSVLASGRAYRGVRLSDYACDWGIPLVLVPLFLATGDNAYKERATVVCDHILSGGIRIADEGIAAGGIVKGDAAALVRERLWVDTLYYTSSPLAQTYQITGERRFAEEAIRQCLVHARYLQDPASGLFFHDAIPEKAVRPGFSWSRGNGWVILSLLDTLRYCPGDMEGRDAVLQIYVRLSSALLRLQHPCGLWRIVPEDEESHLETSGTAMILLGLLRGVEAGYLEKDALARVRRGLYELCTWIRPNGSLGGAQRPAGLGGWETHKLSDLGECTYASGIFLSLLVEAAQSKALAS